MERRSFDGAVAMATMSDEGHTLLGAAVAAFEALPSQAERSLAARLSQELAEGSSHSRVRAASSLADVAGIHAAPLLARAIDDADPDLRVALADALGRTGGSDAIAAVDSLRRDADALVRAAAVDAAARLLEGDPEALRTVFREAIADPDPRVRRRAALQAASTRGIDPGEILAKVLEDDDRQARRLAAVALGATRRKDAALALVDALLDEDDAVRDAATGSAALLFGAEAERIAGLEPLRRGRAVARLRAHVAANASLPGMSGELLVSCSPTTRNDDEGFHDAANGDAFDAAAHARRQREDEADVRAAAHADPIDTAALDRGQREDEADVRAAAHSDPFDLAALDLGQREDEADVRAAAHEPGQPTAVSALASHVSSEDDYSSWDDDEDVGAEGEDPFQASYLPMADTEPAARLDHELDEDVLAVMHALSLARTMSRTGNESTTRPQVEAEDDLKGEVPDGTDTDADVGTSAAAAGPEFESIESVLRAALRGATPEDLAGELGLSALALGPVLEEHLDAGRIVRRGKKLFLP